MKYYPISREDIKEEAMYFVLQVGLTSGRCFAGGEESGERILKSIPPMFENMATLIFEDLGHEDLLEASNADIPLRVMSPFLDQKAGTVDSEALVEAIEEGQVYVEPGIQFHYVSHGSPIPIEKQYFKEKGEPINLCLLGDYSGPFRLYVQFAGKTIDVVEMEKPEGDCYFTFEMSKYPIYRKERLDLEVCIPGAGGSYVRFFID